MSIQSYTCASVLIVLLSTPASAEELPTLDELLDERIEKNIEYRDKFAKDAEESIVAEILIPAEKDVGQRWIDLLRYVRESDDIELKCHMLRLDYAEEVRGSVYDLEYAEGVVETLKTRAQLAYWQLRLDLVDKVASQQETAGKKLEASADSRSNGLGGEKIKNPM